MWTWNPPALKRISTMTARDAHHVLDCAALGLDIPVEVITEALHATGDLPIAPHAAHADERHPQ